MGDSLYRFIDLFGLMDIVQKKALTMVPVNYWGDPYEGFILQRICTPEGWKEFHQIAAQNDLNVNNPMISLMATTGPQALAGQCWTVNADADLMWRSYSYESKAVRIEVDIDKLKSFPRCQLEKVTYLDKGEFDLATEVRRLFTETDRSFRPGRLICIKRNHFKHEEEFRLIYVNMDLVAHSVNTQGRPRLDPEKVNLDIPASELALHTIQKGKAKEADLEAETMRYKEILTRSFFGPSPVVPIKFDEEPGQFIKSVMLHPGAPDWVDSILRQYCQINGLKYLGKSKLYSGGQFWT